MIIKQPNIGNNLAQEIVDAVKIMVGKDINFIDQNGTITASTDKTRIGSFNGAGYNAVTTGDVTVVDIENRYKQSRLGISYPIVIQNKPIGAVGITGNPDEVYKFGFMITKITEIFIKENSINHRYKSKENLMDYIIKSIVYKEIIEDDIKGYLMDFGIYLEDDVSIIFISIEEQLNTSINLHEIENKIINFFEISDIKIYTYMYPNKFIGVLTKQVYKNIELKYLDYFKEDMVKCGVGKLVNVTVACNSYEQAKLALMYPKSRNCRITLAKNISLEIMMENIDKNTKDEYVSDILSNLDNDEIELLKLYYDNNISLKLTSECLYIHKNTLQYRLDKIKSKIGLDPRNFKDSTKLYIAIILRTTM